MIRTIFRTCIVLAVGQAVSPARVPPDSSSTRQALLECVADTWIAHGETSPHGRDRELLLGRSRVVLLNFRTAAVEGWKIERATLLLSVHGSPAPREIRIGTPRLAWSEDRAGWTAARATRVRRYRTRPYQEGWIAIDLDPRAVGNHGLALIGDGAAVVLDSRETVGHSPYLLVEGSR